MSDPSTWKVVTANVEELEKHLNLLAGDGFEIFSVLQVGASEPMSNVPRDHKSLEQRTTFAIVAHRRAA
ncbi:MAG: hypothetical protein K0Q72_1039 [Armatimonadetes bacterium]|jgi:hypothetical protein|nr:hypothetical protein [Armatimonadota bacterium]